MEDCEAGHIQLILTKSISRFARNTVDLLNTVRHLKELGVEVRFEKERIHSLSDDGELMLTLLASFAQEESRSISENAKWAIRKRYERGEGRNSILYGYRAVEGKLVVEPEEADVVRTIYRLYLDGFSCYMIAQKLTETGVKSYYGRDFTGMAVGSILRQEKYTGNTLLQKYFIEDFMTHREVKNRGELPMYFVEDTHPAIIQRETFDAVQREIAKRYGVEIRNGVAETASYLAHGGEYVRPDYAFRRPQWSEEQRMRQAEKYTSRETAKTVRHGLSLILKCEGCGQNLVASRKKYADGSAEVKWVCLHHYKAVERTPDSDEQRPVPLDDATVKAMTASVLGLDAFDADVMCRELSRISVRRDTLAFCFRDGRKNERRYIPPKRKYRRKKV